MAIIRVTKSKQGPDREVTGFPRAAKAIVKSDVDVYDPPVTVYVGAAGNVTIMPADGTTVVEFVAVPAGGVVPCRARQVMNASTAGSMVAVA